MNKIKQYLWVFEWIISAILIAVAIVTIINQELIYYIFGSIFIIFGLFRIFPLVKTTESTFIKWVILAELIIDIIIGVILFVMSNKTSFDSKLFGYLIGSVLYLRGFIHFFATSIKSEPSSIIGFVTNIVLLTLGTIIIFNGGFSLNTFKWIFTVVLIICVTLLIWRGCIDYRNYRGYLVGSSKLKMMKKELINQTETFPTSEELEITIVPEDGIVEENKDNVSSIEV